MHFLARYDCSVEIDQAASAVDEHKRHKTKIQAFQILVRYTWRGRSVCRTAR